MTMTYPVSYPVTYRCRWCDDDLEHCHETLVVHAIGDVDCLDADCQAPSEAHHSQVSCQEFACGCNTAPHR